MNRLARLAAAPLIALALAAPGPASAATAGAFTLQQVLDYPFESDLVAAPHGGAVAWVRDLEGVRNIWVGRGPDFTPVQVTHYDQDDGQELTQLAFSSDGARLIYVRGGDHDANWPAEGGLAPDPASSPEQPTVAIWSIAFPGGAPVKAAEGDAPALSSRGVLAFIKDKQVWTAPLDGKGKAERLFFDRGADGALAWSPDGSALAFVSNRGDHAFIGVYIGKASPITYLAPTTSKDSSPRWSPDGTRVAFIRRPGEGGPPEPFLTEIPQPWSIWTADARTGAGAAVWRGPKTLLGSYPEDLEDEADLFWAAGDHLLFRAELDGWPHLYSVAAAGGAPTLLTPGDFMVEHVTLTPDQRSAVYDANTGATRDDGDRRHIFRVAVDGGGPATLTSGDGIEDQPAAASGGAVAFIAAGPRRPPYVALVGPEGAPRRTLSDGGAPSTYPSGDMTTPRSVTFTAADGVTAHGQLFQQEGAKSQPGVVFVHGGPPRQMLLGWHYMGYYSNAYAVNQYLAAHGFTVLSVNYRLGIGYGRAYQHPQKAGPTGASEYQDVVAGARFLQSAPGVDPSRIGIWGGSYGGYLTALALARNSDVFKAGVDLHGVHDWWRDFLHEIGPLPDRFEKGDRDQARIVAWTSSPDADIARWRSPVLLIQGDDDRNVDFQQTVDLARRLEDQNVPFEELVIPNEIHGFLRHESWLKADAATVRFLQEKLGAGN